MFTKGGNSKTKINDYINKIPEQKDSMFLAPCTELEICKLIDNLPNKNSSGYDDISNILLKRLKQSLLSALVLLFNDSISQGHFPAGMKLADVIPLFKGGNKQILTNYRLISLLPIVSKLLEKIIYVRTYNFLCKHNILFNSQYGFRKHHSCEQAVTELVGEVCKGLEKDMHTIAIFIDLSKDFDTISHEILFTKLEQYGIRGTALS